MQDFKNLCYNCMAKLGAPGGVCPKCGWDNARRESGQGYLPACVLKGQYFVGRALGRGGFGVTYLGYDLNLNRRVAIKEYFPQSLAMRTRDDVTIAPYEDSKEQFEWGRRRALDEGIMTANLEQVPNAVQVHNAFEENGTVYIVMQYIEGKTLSQMVADNGPMPWAQAYGLIKPIMRALEAIHAQGVIHRDVSPDNIMLRENSASTVLLDFGAARSYADEKQGLTATLRPGYAPPEQYSSMSKQDGRTDEYALCATLYFLLTGVTPPSSDQIAYSDTPLSTPHSLGAKLPGAAEAALLRGMSPKMEDRYASIADLRATFDAAGSGEEYLSTEVYPGPTPGAPQQSEKPKPRSSRRALLALALAAILVAGGFFAGMKLTRGKQDSSLQQNQEASVAAITTESATNAPTELPVEASTAMPTETPTELPTESPTEAPTDEPIPTQTTVPEAPCTFTERAIERAIRQALGRPTGDIYFSELDGITQLDLSEKSIYSVQDLIGLTKLRRLVLSGNYISDISPLCGLTSLSSLYLSNNRINDISPLNGLSNLTKLDLSSNSISDFGPLSEMANLTYLNLSDNSISDISPLCDLIDLTYLNLSQNSISDINPLRGLTNLTRLSLSDNQISDISALAGMTNLTYLNLSQNNVSDFSPLAEISIANFVHDVPTATPNLTPTPTPTATHESPYTFTEPAIEAAIRKALGKSEGEIYPSELKRITELNLSKSNISNIHDLIGLSNLKRLDLSKNNISDISALGDLTNLMQLSLYSNNISDISTLSGLTNLTQLSLYSNRISDLHGLNGLPNLKRLDLSDNRISDISALGGLTNLTRLSLSDNQISDISALSELINLTTLYLYNNSISDISPLSRMTELGTLGLEGNPIRDFSPVEKLNIPMLFRDVPASTTILEFDQSTLNDYDMLYLDKKEVTEQVQKLQSRLIELGYLDDQADGEFGKKTQRAVYDFQKNNGFSSPSGVASPITQYVLFSDTAISSQQPPAPVDKNRGNALRITDLGYSTDDGMLRITGNVKNVSQDVGIVACVFSTILVDGQSESIKNSTFYYTRQVLGDWQRKMIEPGREKDRVVFGVLDDVKPTTGIRANITEVYYSDGQVYHNFDGYWAAIPSSGGEPVQHFL